jgi:hypothetical protein
MGHVHPSHHPTIIEKLLGNGRVSWFDDSIEKYLQCKLTGATSIKDRSSSAGLNKQRNEKPK